MQSLLAAASLRVDVGGIPAVDGLSMESTGDCILVLGAARALFEAAAGLRVPASGELRVGGLDPLDASRKGAAAAAPLDPPLPPKWTLLQYVRWSARLAGHAAGTARELAGEAIERLKLEGFASHKLSAVTTAARRGAVVAAALATGADVVLVEDPLVGLPPEAARPFARIVVRALEDRRTVFFAARAPLDSPIALAVEEALVIDGSRVAAQGAPAEIAAAEGAFVLRVGGDAGAFLDAVKARGGKVLGEGGGPPHASFTLDLGQLGTLDLLRIAAESNAVVLELRPVARTFA